MQTNTTNIIDRLKQGICEINVGVEPSDIPLNEGLLATGILDSGSFLELIEFMESEFGFEIEEDEFTVENMKDLMAMKMFIERKIG